MATEYKLPFTGDEIKNKLSYEPTTLPNPHPLKFTGAVTGSYDGSEIFTVEIPNGDDSKQYVFEKINDITLTERVQCVTIETDFDGNPFETEMAVMYIEPFATPVNETTKEGRVGVTTDVVTIDRLAAVTNVYATVNGESDINSWIKRMAFIKINNGILEIITGEVFNDTVFSCRNCSIDVDKNAVGKPHNKIKGLHLNNSWGDTNVLGIGTKIIVWIAKEVQ